MITAAWLAWFDFFFVTPSLYSGKISLAPTAVSLYPNCTIPFRDYQPMVLRVGLAWG